MSNNEQNKWAKRRVVKELPFVPRLTIIHLEQHFRGTLQIVASWPVFIVRKTTGFVNVKFTEVAHNSASLQVNVDSQKCTLFVTSTK